MIYLIDASVLITANNTYYNIKAIPEFWSWLLDLACNNKIKLPIEIYEEITQGNKDDPLYLWIVENKGHFILNEDVGVDSLRSVINNGYAPDLTDNEIEQLGRDPFLLAYAHNDSGKYGIVTAESSKPSKKRQYRKIPDVCSGLNIKCLHTFEFIRELNFSTNWDKK